jgi:hypothetical protein
MQLIKLTIDIALRPALFNEPIDLLLAFYIAVDYVTVRSATVQSTLCICLVYVPVLYQHKSSLTLP